MQSLDRTPIGLLLYPLALIWLDNLQDKTLLLIRPHKSFLPSCHGKLENRVDSSYSAYHSRIATYLLAEQVLVIYRSYYSGHYPGSD